CLRAVLSVRAVPQEHDERRKPGRHRLRLRGRLGLDPLDDGVYWAIAPTYETIDDNWVCGSREARDSWQRGLQHRSAVGWCLVQPRVDAQARFPRRILGSGGAIQTDARWPAGSVAGDGRRPQLRRWPGAATR